MIQQQFAGPQHSVSLKHLSSQFAEQLLTLVQRGIHEGEKIRQHGPGADAYHVVEHAADVLVGAALQLAERLDCDDAPDKI